MTAGRPETCEYIPCPYCGKDVKIYPKAARASSWYCNKICKKAHADIKGLKDIREIPERRRIRISAQYAMTILGGICKNPGWFEKVEEAYRVLKEGLCDTSSTKEE